MTDILEQPDDFSDLDEETREFITRKTHEIHGLMRRTAEEIIIIGENLLMVQQRLPEMKFAAWLRAEFDFSRQSAYNFMRVANKLGGSCKTVLQLPAKVLYELASSSEAIVQQVETDNSHQHSIPFVQRKRLSGKLWRLKGRRVRTLRGPRRSFDLYRES